MRILKTPSLQIKRSKLLKNVLFRPLLLFLILPFFAFGLSSVNLNNHSTLVAVKKHDSGWTTVNGYDNMFLNDVSCSDTTDCTAVGSYGTQGVGGPSVVSITDGNVGQVSYFQGPNSYIGNFTADSCSSIGNCLAVGYTYDNSGNFHPAYSQEVNGAWGNVQEVATPAGGSNNELFSGVSCPSATGCVAVGDDEYGGVGSAIIPMYDTFTNGTWGSATELTTPSGYGYLYDISCVDTSDCTAVGTANDANDNIVAPIETSLSNGTWDTTATELSSSDQSATILKSISCVDAADCTVVGQSNDSNGNTSVQIATESQGVWGQISFLGELGIGRMNSISCVSIGNCAAVGFDDLNGYPLYTIETAGAWSSLTPITTSSTAFFYGVGCAQNQTTESCIAVGENEDGSLVGVPFGQNGNHSLAQGNGRIKSKGTGVRGALLMSTSFSRLPTAPTNVAVSIPSSSSLAVTWQPPAFPGNSTIKYYKVTATSGNHMITSTTASLGHTFKGLNSIGLYSIQVSAYNSDGHSIARQARYQVYPVTSQTPRIRAIPAVVKSGNTFTLLTYGDRTNLTAFFTEQGSRHACVVNSAHQCWINFIAGSTGVKKVTVKVGTQLVSTTINVIH